MESLDEKNSYPVVPRSNLAGYRSEKKPPSNRGPELERTVLSMPTIIALSSLAERFFETHQTLSLMKSMAPSNAKIAIVTYIIFTSACSKDNGLLLSRLTPRRTSKLLKLISNMGSKRSDFAPVIPF